MNVEGYDEFGGGLMADIQDVHGSHVVWGDDVGATWENAPDHVKEQFAMVRLYWFFRMIDSGGPDGSDLDAIVQDEAREAAAWLGPILEERAQRAGW